MPLVSIAKNVFQGQLIYTQLPSPEQSFDGTVTVRQLGEPTPNKIMGRYYTLMTASAMYPLPTPSGPQVLADFVGRQVTVRGKVQALIWSAVRSRCAVRCRR